MSALRPCRDSIKSPRVCSENTSSPLDHQIIGLQYALTSLCFLLIGFSLAIVFLWQLAWPTMPVPLAGTPNATGGIILPEFYNRLVAMHGTISWCFLAVVLLSVGAFWN